MKTEFSHVFGHSEVLNAATSRPADLTACISEQRLHPDVQHKHAESAIRADQLYGQTGRSAPIFFFLFLRMPESDMLMFI